MIKTLNIFDFSIIPTLLDAKSLEDKHWLPSTWNCLSNFKAPSQSLTLPESLTTGVHNGAHTIRHKNDRHTLGGVIQLH